MRVHHSPTLMETDAIASAVIGGISMAGGTGKCMVHSCALLMASLDNGMRYERRNLLAIHRQRQFSS